MRILAPRKRDSVTGEEVVLTVTNAVVTSTTRRSVIITSAGNNNNNNNNNNFSGTCINAETNLVAPTTPSSSPLHEKLLNRFGSTTNHNHHHDRILSSLCGSVSHEKQRESKHKVNSGKLRKKSEKNASLTCNNNNSSNNWKSRIGESVINYCLLLLHSHCCGAQDKRDSLQLQQLANEKDSVSDQYVAKGLKCVVDDSNKKIVEQRKEKIYNKKESQDFNGCAIATTTTTTTAIDIEGSQPTLIIANICSLPLSTCSDNAATSPPFTQSIHVENTTKSASDKNLVAVVGTANFKIIMRTGIYHEKQVKSLCALHALNNLLQDGKAFKQEDLDKICSELDPNSWVNPHKSVFGLGNYDINVIMTALQQKKLEAVWFDKRKDPSEELNFGNIYGFILNIPSDCRLGWLALPIKRKHWVAIRNLPSITEKDTGKSSYYNLDSKYDKPDKIGSTENLIEYLRSELKSPEKELFLVVTEDIGKLETWRKNPRPPPCSSTSGTAASGTSTHLLPVPSTSGESGPDAAAGSGNNRRTSNDSGVVDLLPDLRDINVVDLNKEDLMRRQSSGVWSDLT